MKALAAKRIAIVLAVLAALVRAPLVAEAGPKEGQRNYERGVRAYKLGHFAEAIAAFEKAYLTEEDPILLYNIAQSHRQLGNNDQAAFFYRRFLEDSPNSPQRAEVEAKLAETAGKPNSGPAGHVNAKPVTQGALATPANTAPSPASAHGAQASPTAGQTLSIQTAPDAATASTVAPSVTVREVGSPLSGHSVPEATAETRGNAGRNLRWAGIGTAAAGAGAVAVGVIFSLRADAKSSEVGSTRPFNASDESAGKQAATLQWVFYGAGAAAIVAGATLYYLGRQPQSNLGGESSRTAFVIMPTWADGRPGAAVHLAY